MPINVGYTPVGAVGEMAYGGGQGQYQRWLAEFMARTDAAHQARMGSEDSRAMDPYPRAQRPPGFVGARGEPQAAGPQSPQGWQLPQPLKIPDPLDQQLSRETKLAELRELSFPGSRQAAELTAQRKIEEAQREREQAAALQEQRQMVDIAARRESQLTDIGARYATAGYEHELSLDTLGRQQEFASLDRNIQSEQQRSLRQMELDYHQADLVYQTEAENVRAADAHAMAAFGTVYSNEAQAKRAEAEQRFMAAEHQRDRLATTMRDTAENNFKATTNDEARAQTYLTEILKFDPEDYNPTGAAKIQQSTNAASAFMDSEQFTAKEKVKGLAKILGEMHTIPVYQKLTPEQRWQRDGVPIRDTGIIAFPDGKGSWRTEDTGKKDIALAVREAAADRAADRQQAAFDALTARMENELKLLTQRLEGQGREGGLNREIERLKIEGKATTDKTTDKRIRDEGVERRNAAKWTRHGIEVQKHQALVETINRNYDLALKVALARNAELPENERKKDIDIELLTARQHRIPPAPEPPQDEISAPQPEETGNLQSGEPTTQAGAARRWLEDSIRALLGNGTVNDLPPEKRAQFDEYMQLYKTLPQ
jgi:hypothetical protein